MAHWHAVKALLFRSMQQTDQLPEVWRKELSFLATFTHKNHGYYFDERDEGMAIKFAKNMREKTDVLPSGQILQFLIRHGCKHESAQKFFVNILEREWR